jgi:hypothetical protein
MIRPIKIFTLAVSLLLFPLFSQEAVAQAPVALSIRMVNAGIGTEIDPSLKDVANLMRGNLAFSSFKLVESEIVNLPASAPVKMKSYKITLTGPANNLDVVISHAGRTLVKTHVELKGHSPLVLGGFSARDGTILFVLNLAK